jgi:hypothetical protein
MPWKYCSDFFRACVLSLPVMLFAALTEGGTQARRGCGVRGAGAASWLVNYWWDRDGHTSGEMRGDTPPPSGALQVTTATPHALHPLPGCAQRRPMPLADQPSLVRLLPDCARPKACGRCRPGWRVWQDVFRDLLQAWLQHLFPLAHSPLLHLAGAQAPGGSGCAEPLIPRPSVIRAHGVLHLAALFPSTPVASPQNRMRVKCPPASCSHGHGPAARVPTPALTILHWPAPVPPLPVTHRNYVSHVLACHTTYPRRGFWLHAHTGCWMMYRRVHPSTQVGPERFV